MIQEYYDSIRNHPNYAFLPNELREKWVVVSKDHINPRNIFWEKEKNLRIERNEIDAQSKFANLARYLHPTKEHICQHCECKASIYYVYPTKNTAKTLRSIVSFPFNTKDTIFDIYARIEDIETKKKVEAYFKIDMELLRIQCYSDRYNGKKLSPGVMANPPDRLDGFHTYNSICGCRKQHDKGRSDSNMKSYTRDRRCYELYSDGNYLLANRIMGALNTLTMQCSQCKQDSPMTADHIGPISLGFLHDPRNFLACCAKCNSAKNNRITSENIAYLRKLEADGISVISWWAKSCWNASKHKDIQSIKHALDRNAKKFLQSMDWIKEKKPAVLSNFLNEYTRANISYDISHISVDPSNGYITYTHTEKQSAKKTKDTQKARIQEILRESSKKTNRKVTISFTEKELELLNTIEEHTMKDTICRILE